MVREGMGSLLGRFSGVTPFKGKASKESREGFQFVHFETDNGKATFLTEKAFFNKRFRHLRLGTLVMVFYSEISRGNDVIYVLEDINEALL